METLLFSEWPPLWMYVWVKYKLKLSRKGLNIAHLIVWSLKAIVPLILIKYLLGYPIVKNMNGKSSRTSSKWTWQETLVWIWYSQSVKSWQNEKKKKIPLSGKKWLSALWPFFQLGKMWQSALYQYGNVTNVTAGYPPDSQTWVSTVDQESLYV